MSTIEVTGLFRGTTIPLRDIVAQIEGLGWQMDKVDFRKDSFVASARNPHGEKIERTGVTDASAAANVLLAILRRHQIRTGAQHYGGMWQTTWADKLAEIAEAYSKAPVYDPKAAPAWRELAQDSVARAEVLKQQLTIKVVDDPEPYPSAAAMAEDIHKKKNFLVSRANCEHPIWSVEENIAFRIVHDVLGHAVSGGDFGWHGENLACAAHFPLLTPNAQRALFTECIGQTGYAAYYRSFGPQKVAFLDEFLEPAQKIENDPAHTGVHPAESFAPTSMPRVEPSPGPEEIGAYPDNHLAPHKVDAITNQQPVGVFSKIAATALDPNHGWQSGAEPLPGQSAFMDKRLPTPDGRVVDPLDAEGVMNNASLIDTGWHSWTKEDGTLDRDKMKQAIVNAFRVVLLSPRKDLRWNAVHYQDIAHVPADEKDPKVYWDALEHARQEWNVRHFGEHNRYTHLEHYKYLPKFKAILHAHYPHLKHHELDKKAHDMMYEWFMQEQDKIMAGDADKPSHKQMSGDEVERKANSAMKKRMEKYVKDAHLELDFAHIGAAESEQLGFDIEVPEVKVENPGRYGAFMGTHLKAIAQISEHADTILDAALRDVHEHDGAGHHFRAAVLQLNVSGVGPKVCSFAWLLLQPMTSQLGTIDTHMMDVLGRNYEKEMNNRDYFKFERELAAGRDAAGYAHVPLGAFQWGMWDYKRTGPGSHQDHSAMAVINPKPHEHIDWESKAQNLKGEEWAKQAPHWWKETEEARKRAAEEFETTVNVPVGKIPFKVVAKEQIKVAASGSVPWLIQDGNIYTGAPRQTYAQFVRSTLGMPAHHFWHLDNIALGRYNPDSDSIEIAAGEPIPELHEHLRAILGPEPQETVSEPV